MVLHFRQSVVKLQPPDPRKLDFPLSFANTKTIRASFLFLLFFSLSSNTLAIHSSSRLQPSQMHSHCGLTLRLADIHHDLSYQEEQNDFQKTLIIVFFWGAKCKQGPCFPKVWYSAICSPQWCFPNFVCKPDTIVNWNSIVSCSTRMCWKLRLK